jgi:hypothetical protein
MCLTRSSSGSGSGSQIKMDGDTPDDLIEYASAHGYPPRVRLLARLATASSDRGASEAAHQIAHARPPAFAPALRYSLRMLGFGASAVAGLFFTIFIGPVQAFMRNPRTAAITGVAVGVLFVLLLITLRAMTTADVAVPREALEQADFNAFQPPRIQ